VRAYYNRILQHRGVILLLTQVVGAWQVLLILFPLFNLPHPTVSPFNILIQRTFCIAAAIGGKRDARSRSGIICVLESNRVVCPTVPHAN
jgi:hypothetical protein